MLLKEIHHRVKNNLQIVSSLLRMQTRTTKNKDINNMLAESRNRINAMALIHAQLYESKDMSEINIKRFMERLMIQLLQSNPTKDTKVTPTMHVEDYPLPIAVAMPVGLITNELITNSLKHAFAGRKIGKIKIDLTVSRKGKISFTVSDDGVGLPKGFNADKSKTLGLHLVKILTEEQLQGKLKITSGKEKGSKFKIEFDTK
ncbi:MAG: sensor histidine kinase [archaeon]|nr:sensor histidine kinase [archaeon]